MLRGLSVTFDVDGWPVALTLPKMVHQWAVPSGGVFVRSWRIDACSHLPPMDWLQHPCVANDPKGVCHAGLRLGSAWIIECMP